MKQDLKKPTILNIILGNIILVIKEQIRDLSMNSPKKIDKYSLLKTMSRPHKSSNSTIGIYALDGKKYFIKTWTGKIKDINYYCLVNQYLINKAFNEVFKNKSKQFNIRTPKVVEYIESDNDLSVVYEYLDGKILTKLDPITQAKVIVQVASSLKKFSDSLSEDEKKYFSKRSRLFYVFTLILSSTVLLVLSPKNFKVIFISLSNSIAVLLSKRTIGETLAHRDLLPKNIMVGEKNIYLLDLETMVLTLPGYDYSFLQVEPSSRNIAEIVNKKFHKYGDRAIKKMIALQFAVSLTNPFGLQKDYMKTLYTLNNPSASSR